MIHVTLAPEPPDFDAKVRQPGERAIAEMTGQPPASPRTAGKAFKQRTREVKQADGSKLQVLINRPDELPSSEFQPYWTEAIKELMQAYDETCAYSCFRIHPVTGAASVDHMAPKSCSCDCVYEWENYRLAASRLNARKNDFGDVLDPFDIQDGWFVLELVGFQVLPAHGLPDPLRTQIQQTIDRLGLDDFRAEREKRAKQYWEGKIAFEVLEEEAPFVAKELRRHGRLMDGDV